MPTSRNQKVKAAVTKIRRLYQTGTKLPTKTSHHDAYNKHIIDRLAEQEGVSDTKIRQARQFAASYSPEELDDLCGLIERIQPKQEADLPLFGLTHVLRLLSVRPKHRRQALQRKAIEKGWSCRELEREIAKRFGTRQDGGRRRKIPSTLEDFLIQAEMMCEAWRRWHVELSLEFKGIAKKHVVLDELPEEIKKGIKVAGEAISALHQDVVEELKKSLPDRQVRGKFRAGESESRASRTE